MSHHPGQDARMSGSGPGAAPGTEALTISLFGQVAVIGLDAPFAGGRLGPGLRLALSQALDVVAATPDMLGIVLSAGAADFPAGAGIAELNDIAARGQEAAPTLAALCARVADSALPVVAALRGRVSGGGLELALAARGRVATPDSWFSMPALRLGLVPGAGGTQRLPRLIGAGPALHFLLEMPPTDADAALQLGLIDAVAPGDLTAAAIGLAMALPSPGPDLLQDGIAAHRAIAAARAGLETATDPAPGQVIANPARARMIANPARVRMIDCVEAAQLLVPAAGADFEAAAWLDLLQSPFSAALRQAAGAAQRAARFTETRMAALPAPAVVTRLGIVGAAAADMALMALQIGLEVVLVEPDRPALLRALEKIAAQQQRAVAEGRLSPERRQADWSRLVSDEEPAALAECEVVLVSRPGQLALAAGAVPEGRILALIGRGDWQAGSSLSGSGMAGREADILGLHSGGGTLAELAVPPGAAAGKVLGLARLAQRLGLRVLRCAVPRAGAGRSLAREVMGAGRAAIHELLARGEDRRQIAEVLSGFGLPMLSPSPGPEGRSAARPSGGLTDTQIRIRLLTAMANAGAMAVSQGEVECPAMVDFALVAGQGYPQWQAGPMAWADGRGLGLLRHDLAVWHSQAGPQSAGLWEIAPALADLAERGGCFADLDRI